MQQTQSPKAGERTQSEQPEFLLRAYGGRIIQTKQIKSEINVYAGSYGIIVRGSEDVKKQFRRLRPQEAEQLKALDARMKELRDAIDATHQQRAEVLKLAFQKGHVVFHNEVRESAEANLNRREFQVANEASCEKATL